MVRRRKSVQQKPGCPWKTRHQGHGKGEQQEGREEKKNKNSRAKVSIPKEVLFMWVGLEWHSVLYMAAAIASILFFLPSALHFSHTVQNRSR